MNAESHCSTKWLLLLFFAWGGCATTTAGNPNASSEPARITLDSIKVDPQHPARKNFGPLTLLSSFQLRSNDARFGGISSIALDEDGQTLWGISDRGHWFKAQLRVDQRGVLVGLHGLLIGPLRGLDGRPVQGKFTDAESLVQGTHGEQVVSFEQVHRVWRYGKGLAGLPTPLPVPPALNNAPRNGGLEAIGLLPDGRLLLLCEELEGPQGTRQGWVVQGANQMSILYPVSEGFVPTDLAVLKDGVVLVLERHFSVFAGPMIRIRTIQTDDLTAGVTLQPRELIRFARPLEVDNFEGLTTLEDGVTGEVTLFLISDDNFSALQRTLLYQFRLPASALNARRKITRSR